MAYVNLGTIKIDLDKLIEAEELFLNAIKINENYNYAYINLFRLYEKNEPDKQIKNTIENLNRNKNIINEILMFNAESPLEKKNFIKAKKFIDQVSSEWIINTDHSTNLLFWSFKAFIEEKVKNYNEAFKCFEKSQLNLKYEDTNPEIFQDYIRTYRKNIDNDVFLAKTKLQKYPKNRPYF